MLPAPQLCPRPPPSSAHGLPAQAVPVASRQLCPCLPLAVPMTSPQLCPWPPHSSAHSLPPALPVASPELCPWPPPSSAHPSPQLCPRLPCISAHSLPPAVPVASLQLCPSLPPTVPPAFPQLCPWPPPSPAHASPQPCPRPTRPPPQLPEVCIVWNVSASTRLLKHNVQSRLCSSSFVERHPVLACPPVAEKPLPVCPCPCSLPPCLWFISSLVQPGRKFREPTFGFTDHIYFWLFPVISAFAFTSLLVEVLY